MREKIIKDELLVPVYINEKIVLDMLAIIEDGFSTVSQVNFTEYKEDSSLKKVEAGVSTSASILSKLLKINLSGDLSHLGNGGENKTVETEKVHTNVSLLSRFRSHLVNENILRSKFVVSNIQVGDFIEIEGVLQKNPLIDYMERFVDIFRMANIFDEKPPVGNRTQAKDLKKQEEVTMKQIQSFSNELKHSGTIDFILSEEKGTLVLSAQEQYLSNDNISEIIGGHFKVLGKVIAVCKDETEGIDLLRKTTLSVLPESLMKELFSELQGEELSEFNLPSLVTKINGPAMIVIPIAIYA